jgi:hypothetical protein
MGRHLSVRVRPKHIVGLNSPAETVRRFGSEFVARRCVLNFDLITVQLDIDRAIRHTEVRVPSARREALAPGKLHP